MAKNRASQRFVRSTVDGLPVLVYDRLERRVVHEITDYALHLKVVRALSPLSIGQETSNLVSFWRFLRTHSLRLSDVSDRTLIRFRDEDVIAVMEQPSGKGKLRIARATVNQKLRSIYNWLWWHSDRQSGGPMLIGPVGHRVKSAAPPGTKSRAVWGKVHPILFTETGASSKHRAGYAATQETYDDATDAIMATDRDPYVQARDCIVLDIARHVGFRRGSICSLTVDQFDRRELQAHLKETIHVVPASQKLGYENQFEVPVWLALQICDFIEGPRTELLERHRVSPEKAPREILISARTCKPITPRAITHSLRLAMRTVGAPKGAVLHTFRGLFANDAIERQIERRIQFGLDTSTAAICAAVALELGHRNPMSLFSYVTRAQGRYGLEQTTSREKVLTNLKRQVEALTRERDELRNRLERI